MRTPLAIGAVHRIRTCKPFQANCFQGSSLTTRTDGMYYFMELCIGIEPMILVLQTSALTNLANRAIIMVGEDGFEPPQPQGRLIYSQVQLTTLPLTHIFYEAAYEYNIKLSFGAKSRIRTYGPFLVDTLAMYWFRPLTHLGILQTKIIMTINASVQFFFYLLRSRT